MFVVLIKIPPIIISPGTLILRYPSVLVHRGSWNSSKEFRAALLATHLADQERRYHLDLPAIGCGSHDHSDED